MKKIKGYLKNKYIVGALIAVVIIGGIVLSRRDSGKASFETTKATVATVTETVSVTGKVTPFEKSDLGFEKGGTIAGIYVKVGDHVARGATIASLKDDQTYASLVGAQANLAAAEANLADNNTNTQIDYVNAQKNAVNAAREAYNKVNSTILNEADTFFRNGSSVNPTLTLTADSYTIGRSVETKRVEVTNILTKWESETNSTADPKDATTLLQNARTYIGTVRDFANALSVVVQNASRNNASLSQSTIDSYNSTINTVSSDISSAFSTITSAENSLNSTAPKSVKSLEAKIAQARADVANYQAQYAKSRVSAPFTGVITLVSPHIGDVVGAGQTEFSMIADQSFKVEVNVPEADIAKIKVADKSTITLDAYGDGVVFNASVIAIDPAETVIEGVPTYKVTLQFDQKDDRVRSGMTANIDIVTNVKVNVVAIPFRAVIDQDGKKQVRVVNADGKSFTSVPVELGLKGSDGMVEIVSGIQSGTTVVTFAK